MNDLEQWLADVKEFNADVVADATDWGLLLNNRAGIEYRGRALGLKRSKIKSMLASVKLKVEMPEEKDGT